MSQDPYAELARQQAKAAKTEASTDRWMGCLLKTTVLVMVIPLAIGLICGGWILFEAYVK
jgi:hypothetical protein